MIYKAHKEGEFDGVFQDGMEDGADLYVYSAIGWIKVTDDFTTTVAGNMYALTYNIAEEVVE